MRAATFALAAATTALAQNVSLPAGLNISSTCEQTLYGLVANSSYSCLHVQDLVPIITSNGSIIPYLDNWMSDLCYTEPCSNATLDALTTSIATGCASDLESVQVNASYVGAAVQQYSLVREILCTKTSDPYTAESYGGFLGAPPIPITGETYNATNGTFCVTSVLTQLSAYYGANLSVPYIESIANGTNTTALNLTESINPNIICNECIFATFDLVNAAYPMLGNATVAQVLGYAGLGSFAGSQYDNYTLAQIADGECAYAGLQVTSNGTLPADINVSIVNSTFAIVPSAGNGTLPAPAPVPGNTTLPNPGNTTLPTGGGPGPVNPTSVGTPTVAPSQTGSVGGTETPLSAPSVAGPSTSASASA